MPELTQDKREKYLDKQEKKRLFIKSMFWNPKQKVKEGKKSFSEQEAEDISKKIVEIGKIIGDHKYNVWLAKEAKKNLQIIELTNLQNIIPIFNWVRETNADILRLSYDVANEEQKQWHKEEFIRRQIKNIKMPDIEPERVIFRVSDKKHFFYLLNDREVETEGLLMGHCVGGQHYRNKIKRGESFIVSLRDHKNKPHITIEINAKSGMVVQQQGKGNKGAIKKYKSMVTEFALYSAGYEEIQDKEILDILNLNFS